jgi:hypothetical protein
MDMAMTDGRADARHALRLYAWFVLAVACAACGALDPNDRLMTDEELTTRFHRERASFDSLATMLDEDRSIRFMDSYAEHLDTGGPYNAYHEANASVPEVSSERWNTYTRLLRRIAVGRNVWSDSTHVLFQQYVNRFGPVESRWMRGYYYARQPLGPRDRVETGDLLADRPPVDPMGQGSIVYKHLDGPWYLYSHHGYTD